MRWHPLDAGELALLWMTRLFPLAKKERKQTDSNYLIIVMGQHLSLWMEIQRVERNMHNAEWRTNFHLQWERDRPCEYELLSTYSLFPVRTLYWRPQNLYMMYFLLYPSSLGITNYTKLTAFFSSCVSRRKITCSYDTVP